MDLEDTDFCRAKLGHWKEGEERRERPLLSALILLITGSRLTDISFSFIYLLFYNSAKWTGFGF